MKSGGDVLLRRKRGLRRRAGSMPCIRLRSLIVAFDVCRHWDSSTRRRLVRRSTGSLSLVWCKWSLARIKSNCGIVVSYLSLICPTNHPARSQQLLDVCQRTKSPWCCTRASRRSDRSWCVHIYFSVSNVLLFRIAASFSTASAADNKAAVPATFTLQTWQFFYRLRLFQTKN